MSQHNYRFNELALSDLAIGLVLDGQSVIDWRLYCRDPTMRAGFRRVGFDCSDRELGAITRTSSCIRLS